MGRMRRERVFEGFYVLPSAALFNRHWKIANFVVQGPEPGVAELLDFDDVVMIWRGRPKTITVNLYARDEDGTVSPQLSALLGGPPFEVLAPERHLSDSRPIGTVSPLDWRVLDGLLDGPSDPLTELAARTGLTPRTVKRRRESLVRRGLVRVLPGFNTSRESGLVLYSGQIVVGRVEDLGAVQIPGLYVMQRFSEPPAAWVFGHAPTVAKLQDIEAEIRETPAVLRAELTPCRGGAFARQRLRGWIRGELLHEPRTI